MAASAGKFHNRYRWLLHYITHNAHYR